ncbi:hypothetical protein ELQ35_00325 [Peribacillus cavernae]|uniref:YtkA-like domain-containing protein n=1 Tax=Peribacillus cavernae TaxID=1674310 RepID=A0A3S0VIA8_9BACI|nr:FixH family protein [Peribacillus cavernae]MDQ0217928.1 hypothetical protein [Peribacillus cavernae]RUQ32580.1 hypothetical protein ELQ35_00325 [Peribacillus cavernae]
MRKWLILTLAVLALLGGCATSEQKEEMPKMLNVDFTVQPEKAKLDEPVSFEAKVTYGDEKVTDADEVTFEIWRSQSDKHEKLEAVNGDDGIYKLEKAFSEEGTYYVYAHVTAKRMHTMPKKEFIVGEPSAPEKKGSGQMDHSDHNEEEAKESSHQH